MTYQPSMFEQALILGTRAVADDLTAHRITFDEHGATVTCVDQAEANEWLLVMTGLTISGIWGRGLIDGVPVAVATRDDLDAEYARVAAAVTQ